MYVFSANSTEVCKDTYLECMWFYTLFRVGTCISHTGADFGSLLPAMMELRYKSQLYLFRINGPGIVLIRRVKPSDRAFKVTPMDFSFKLRPQDSLWSLK